MAHREDQFAEAESIGGMNVALDDFVVQQPVDDIGALPLGRAEDGRIPVGQRYRTKTQLRILRRPKAPRLYLSSEQHSEWQ